MRQLIAQPFQYSQFVGAWSTRSVRPRHIYRAACGTPTDAPADAWSACGEPLLDVVREPAAVIAGA